MSFRAALGTTLRTPTGRAWLATVAVGLLLLPLWWQVGRWYEERLLQEQRAQVQEETSLRASALSLAINRRLARLQGLYAFVQAELSDEGVGTRFEAFAAGLYAGTYGIRNLALAPGGVVRYVYPTADTEAVLGYEPLQDPRPEIRADVQRAIESGHIVVSGPLELVQGGQGLVARQAVYQDGAFWGLVNVVLDLSVVLDEADLGSEPDDLAFALQDSAGRLLLGSAAVQDGQPVTVRVQLPEETWNLAATPREGWAATIQGPVRIVRFSGLIIIGLLVGLVHLSVDRQARLAEAVRQRTQEILAVNAQLEQDIAERQRAEASLAEREAQYRSIFESTSDGLLIIALDGELVDANPAAARMHGYEAEDFAKLRPEQFIHPDSWPLFARFLEQVRAGETFRARAVDLRKDRTSFPVEILGTGFAYAGHHHALAVVRDITEEVQAYQLLEQRVEERTHELAKLLEVSAKISSTLELEPLLGLILEQLRTVVDYAGASVIVLEDGTLRGLAHRGPIAREAFAEMQVMREDASDLWTALQAQGPLVIDDVRGDAWVAQAFRHAFAHHLDHELRYVRTWVGIPLMVQEHMIGWLSLHGSEPFAYTRHQANLAQTIANQAATAIENARLYEQARRLAILEERQRLARELHDSVSQALYGIGLGARTARTLVERAALAETLKATLGEPLEYVLSLADAALAEMRALIFELRPDSLEREGLVAALARQASALETRHKLEVHTQWADEPELPFEAKETLYRICQEALNNVAKHARASRVDISLQANPSEVRLEVRDNGMGFDPTQPHRGHMGLRSMQERAARMGATLDIESAPGEGTRVLAREGRSG
jgi:PAS domain S-box-containing protein